ncbi:MAG: DUF4743 domain-containing protein [Rhodospirillales bacterium]|jgi:hypothetical protein|nr:DUF4743 domain-containing protein [Rhodospirillales bacterium]
MALLDRVRACDPPELANYLPFRVDADDVGLVTPAFADRLEEFSDVFRVSANAVALAPALRGFEARCGAVAGVLEELARRGHIPGWRDEAYPVGRSFAEPPLFLMERAAVPLFGVRAYGVHVNGIVAGTKAKMWIARRSLTRPMAPGKLDQLVAGGQPAGLGVKQNLVKESAEEANIGPGLAARAVPVGTISYLTERPEGLRNDVLFNYDLVVLRDFRPVNRDGEIEAFYLWPIDEVAAVVEQSEAFKFNCALVVIDFLIRHGHIEADHPDYEPIVRGLHR